MNDGNSNLSTEVPIWQKITLSFKEAASLTGLGEQKLRAIAERKPELTISVNTHKRLKRTKLVEWLESVTSV